MSHRRMNSEVFDKRLNKLVEEHNLEIVKKKQIGSMIHLKIYQKRTDSYVIIAERGYGKTFKRLLERLTSSNVQT